ncbi:MAG: Ig-like domain-containing protein, partial [bacterium]|nr:Ig-like domain-containing protein [bacterium]
SASKLNFKTSNSSVASVSKKGVIKGKKVGTAKITVTLKNNTKVKTTITVKVTTKSQQVVQGGTANTSFGIKIPVVSEFNKIALDPQNYWTGETSESNDFSKAFGEALQEYSKKAKYGIHDSPIQDAGDYVFHTGVAGDDMGPITLWRDPEKGCYYFYYTVSLNDYDEEGVAINRDLSRFLLALITSTPTEVEKAIYESTFTAPDGKEPIKGEWTKIGDCEVKFTWYKPDPYIVEYVIRPAK